MDNESGWVLYLPLTETTADLPWWADAMSLLAMLGFWNWVIAAVAAAAAFYFVFERRTAIALIAFVVSALGLLGGAANMIGFSSELARTSFFDPAGAGDPLIMQHLLWFFGHPETFAALGKFLILVAAFVWAVRSLFQNKRFFAFAIFLIGAAAFLVWHIVSMQEAHAGYSEGRSPSDWTRLPFLISTWLTYGAVAAVIFRFRHALVETRAAGLFLLTAVALFCTGLVLSAQMEATSVDRVFHDTYFAQAYFFTIDRLALFSAALSGFYLAFRWVVGVGASLWLSLAHWLLWSAGALLSVGPWQASNLDGMPRRYADMDDVHLPSIDWAQIGSALLIFSLVFGLLVLLEGLVRRYGRNAWTNDLAP